MTISVRRIAPAASCARAPRLSKLALLSGGVAALALGAVQPALGQEPAAGGDAERITVTGTRIVRTGMVTPTPVTAVGSAELEEMSGSTLLEALAELPPFFNNLVPEQVNGGQNSGGSNLNLRGAGANRTLVLLDGRRMVPSNRFGTVDVAVFPEELVKNVETVTGGASASYGTDAVAGVVNFILDTDYEGLKGHAQYGQTQYGDGKTYEIGAAFGMKVGSRGHLIGSAEMFNQDAISDFEALEDRGYFLQRSRVRNPDAANGPDYLILPYTSPTNWNNTGMIVQPASPATATRPFVPRSSLDRMVFNADGTVSPLELSAISDLGVVPATGAALRNACNCQAEPTHSYGVDADDEVGSGVERKSAFLYYEHQVTDNLKLYGQVLAAHNEVDDRRENISFILTWAPRIFADNAYLPASVRDTMLQEASILPQVGGVPSVGFQLFGLNDGLHGLPDARQITINELVSGTVGFETEISGGGFLDGWVVNGYYQRGENDQSFDTKNGIRVDRIPLALDAVVDPQSGNVVCHVALVDPTNFGDCVPMNIFGGLQNLTPEAVDYIVDDYKHAIQHTTQDFAEVVASGDIWEGWGAGPLSGAVGASYRKETLDQSTPDPTDEFPATPSGVLLSDLGLLPPGIRGLVPQTGATGPDGPIPGIPGVRNVPAGFTGDANSSAVTFSSLRAISGEYDVSEVFGEINAPLLSDLPFARQLDVNGAVRWADYSSAGQVWAYKVGASWQVTNDFRFRVTQSRDVRAPTLRELFDQTRGGVNVTDPLNNNQQISTASLSGGNEDLSVEEADTTTAGVVYQPSFVDRLSLSLDWYSIEIADAINQLTAQTIVTNCAQGDTELCQYVLRDDAGTIIRVDSLFINVDTQKIEGVDLEAAYGFGDFNLRLFSSYLLENSIRNRSGQVDERAGDIGTQAMPELKITANLGWEHGPFGAFLQERYIGEGKIDRLVVEGTTHSVPIPGQVVPATVNDNTVPETFYTDLNLSYRLTDENDARNAVLYFNIDNLLDQEPRATPGVIGRAGTNEYNRSVYDVLGRRFTVGVKMEF